MKITAKVSFAGLNFSAIPGQVLDLPEKIAKDLIGAGYAEAEGAKGTEDPEAEGTEDPEAEGTEEQDAEAVKDEDKRNNAGSDTKSAPRKRNSSK